MISNLKREEQAERIVLSYHERRLNEILSAGEPKGLLYHEARLAYNRAYQSWEEAMRKVRNEGIRKERALKGW